MYRSTASVSEIAVTIISIVRFNLTKECKIFKRKEEIMINEKKIIINLRVRVGSYSMWILVCLGWKRCLS